MKTKKKAKNMNKLKPIKNKSGVALFAVLFIMMFLGILMVQFFVNSQQAQRTAHRFYSSEMARQIAVAAQEEAYAIIYKETDNSESKTSNVSDYFDKIIEAGSSLVNESTIKEPKESSPLFTITLIKTKELAEKAGMDVTATVRVVDFRDKDIKGRHFYEKEGIGTIEIAVNVTAKSGFETKAPGSCNMIRQHDYKVVCIRSKASNRANSYVGSSLLDYVFFIKKGQDDYNNFNKYDPEESNALMHYGCSVNPSISLEIDAESENGLGKVNLGSRDTSSEYESYQCLNISTDTIDLLKFEDGKNATEPHKLEFEITDDSIINELLIPKPGEKNLSQVTNKKAIFKYYRMPIISGYSNDENYNSALINSTILFETKLKKKFNKSQFFLYNSDDEDKPTFFEGIKIKPVNQLKDILTSDVRKQFLNYGYFYIDLSNGKVEGETLDKIANHDSDAREKVRQLREIAKRDYLCFDYDNIILDNDVKKTFEDTSNGGVNYKKLTQVLKSHHVASQAFTYISNELPYVESSESDLEKLPNSNEFYKISSANSEECFPQDMTYPFADFNLWNKRQMKSDYLEKSGMYDKETNTLYLRGINHVTEPVILGDESNPSQKLILKGSGVLIAKGIKINCGIEKANKDSVCVLYSRNGNLIINTKEPIEAALICMGQKRKNNKDDTKNDDTYVKCNGELNLTGSLATDRADFVFWEHDAKHKIKYDKVLKGDDVYQITFNDAITFERVLEKE